MLKILNESLLDDFDDDLIDASDDVEIEGGQGYMLNNARMNRGMEKLYTNRFYIRISHDHDDSKYDFQTIHEALYNLLDDLNIFASTDGLPGFLLGELCPDGIESDCDHLRYPFSDYNYDDYDTGMETFFTVYMNRFVKCSFANFHRVFNKLFHALRKFHVADTHVVLVTWIFEMAGDKITQDYDIRIWGEPFEGRLADIYAVYVAGIPYSSDSKYDFTGNGIVKYKSDYSKERYSDITIDTVLGNLTKYTPKISRNEGFPMKLIRYSLKNDIREFYIFDADDSVGKIDMKQMLQCIYDSIIEQFPEQYLNRKTGYAINKNAERFIFIMSDVVIENVYGNSSNIRASVLINRNFRAWPDADRFFTTETDMCKKFKILFIPKSGEIPENASDIWTRNTTIKNVMRVKPWEMTQEELENMKTFREDNDK